MPRPATTGTFPNCYPIGGIVFRLPSVSISVSNRASNSVNTNATFNDRTASRHLGATQPETVRWWIPLVASTGALLVLVLGTAAMVSGLVNTTLSSIG